MIAECVNEYQTPQVLEAYSRIKEIKGKNPDQIRRATSCLTEAISSVPGTLPVWFVALSLGLPGRGKDGANTYPDQCFSAGSVIKIEEDEVALCFRFSALLAQKQEKGQALIKTGGKSPVLLLPEDYIIPVYKDRQIIHWAPEYPQTPALMRPRISDLRMARWVRFDVGSPSISTIRNASIL